MSRKRTVHHTRQMAVYRRELPFYLMLLPGTLFTLVFSYFPLFGLVMAFQNFVPLRGFQKSEWVGLERHRQHSFYFNLQNHTWTVGAAFGGTAGK